MPNATEVQQQARRIEELIHRLESYREPRLVDTARELVQAVMGLHAATLERMMEIVSERGDAGDEILDRFGRDELAGTVLALYGLHPVDLDTRVRRAIEDLQTRARGRGDVELLGIDEGVVRIRLANRSLRAAVEGAINQAAPDAALVIEEQKPSGFVPVEMLTAAKVRA